MTGSAQSGAESAADNSRISLSLHPGYTPHAPATNCQMRRIQLVPPHFVSRGFRLGTSEAILHDHGQNPRQDQVAEGSGETDACEGASARGAADWTCARGTAEPG